MYSVIAVAGGPNGSGSDPGNDSVPHLRHVETLRFWSPQSPVPDLVVSRIESRAFHALPLSNFLLRLLSWATRRLSPTLERSVGRSPSPVMIVEQGKFVVMGYNRVCPCDGFRRNATRINPMKCVGHVAKRPTMGFNVSIQESWRKSEQGKRERHQFYS
ncbi:uncharacterized protein N7500_007587 [Penicillium coprophilum]|uniref:uncharacterized protein n=1 Tax=Penicillium coprophilum TaxID=36646 RepID=UPI00239E8EBD|nr:uncharacterized protein N7500_007587 [Penicillium coprophilum]KAJ5157936.1 hypothetical protein N7500_007587 [Penicillium coprophilum]